MTIITNHSTASTSPLNNIGLQSTDKTDVYMLAFSTIDALIQITNSLGTDTFNKLKQQGDMATNAKAQANIVQSQIDKLATNGTTEMNNDVRTFMKNNGVQVLGPNGSQSIDDFLNGKNNNLSMADLTTIKNSLDNFSQKSLDTVNTVNLQIQQVTQKMSYLISLLSNLLSARYDQAKGVVQNIR